MSNNLSCKREERNRYIYSMFINDGNDLERERKINDARMQ